MKKLRNIVALVTCGLVVCGGLAAWHVASVLRESVTLTPGSLNYEIAVGAAGFSEIAGRLPESKSELAAGLEKMKIKPSKLSTIRTVKFSPKERDTVVHFTTSNGLAGTLTISGL